MTGFHCFIPSRLDWPVEESPPSRHGPVYSSRAPSLYSCSCLSSHSALLFSLFAVFHNVIFTTLTGIL